MNDVELYGRACALARKVRAAKYPALLPGVAREVIREAAELIEQLAEREVKRCQGQRTTEKR
jgi:hypothetical protein